MSAVSSLVSTDDLVGLFSGDELTAGYPTLELCRRICERVTPGSATDLRHAIYGELPLDEIPVGEREVMARGFAVYVTTRDD